MKSRSLSEQRSFSFRPGYSLRVAVFVLSAFILVPVVLQIYALKRPSQFSPPSSTLKILQQQWEQVLAAAGDQGAADGGDACARKLESATSRLRDTVTFLPLKDIGHAKKPLEGTTWFMSSLNDTYEGEESQYLRFPSAASKGRLLCITGNDTRDGTKNSYALAWADALPSYAILLPGLTFVSETYYDYGNIWHGLAAVMPFVGWHESRGCVQPARWVLYHWGELRAEMGYWVRTITEIAFGQEVTIEDFGGRGDRPTCFEQAVVFRHNEGAMSKSRKLEIYDILRCKARASCNITAEEEGAVLAAGGGKVPVIRMTLLLRTGARSFKNESTVIDIFRTACGKFDGCRFTVAWANKLKTFCEQVRTLSATDLLVSSHGAQLTNMFFMDRNSSVMEFFPKGWLNLAGPGQYVYHWLAGYSGMRHHGAWRDPDGVDCPLPDQKDFRCFTDYFKDQRLGHDAAHFANWTATVLGQVREYKLGKPSTGAGGQPRQREPAACACS